MRSNEGIQAPVQPEHLKDRLDEKATDLKTFPDGGLAPELKTMALEKKVVILEQQLSTLRAKTLYPAERRQCVRVPLRCQTTVVGVDLEKEEPGYVSNLSESGCTVEGHFPVQRNTDVALSIYLGEANQPFLVQLALVRWVKGQLFGVEFVSMQQDQREQLRAVLMPRVDQS